MNVVATLEGEVIYVMVRPSSGVERCMLPMMVYLANAALDNGGYVSVGDVIHAVDLCGRCR